MLNNPKKKTVFPKVKHLTKAQSTSLPYIELTFSNWLKDSHGLYDYQAADNKCEKEVISINKSCNIYRNALSLKTLVIDLDDPREVPIQYIYIGTLLIDRETGTYKLRSAAPPDREMETPFQGRSYTVVRGYQKNGVEGYSLTPGNIIRLGRVEFLVIEVRNNNTTEVLKQTNDLELNTDDYKVQNQMKGSCKICLCDEATEEDPLINPCNCKGSCELIHLSCLKNWINSKVKKQLNGIVCSYNFSKFECEICKGAFPKTVTMKDESVTEMITISKPDKPYMILESLGREEKKQRILHMVYGNSGEGLKVGRGHQCELRVNDISVSRMHADVRFENEQFIVRDRQSKFGTLIGFREDVDIKDVNSLQFGRLLLTFKLKKKLSETVENVDTNSQDIEQ